MGKMSMSVKRQRNDEKTGRVTNFMAGDSFEINPLDTLKMVTASSIFGEPQYYRDGEFSNKGIVDGIFKIDKLMIDYVLDRFDKYKGMKTSEMMEKIIDEALDYDFAAVLDWAVQLRTEYNMRLNPQVIMVRAAIHDKRIEFTKKNPMSFANAQQQVMRRGDDVTSQLTYYLYKNQSKTNVPNILKRSWAKNISSLSRYSLYKYRNHGIGLIDAIRICHASGKNIDELMRTGTVQMAKDNTTWENLRANGATWREIIENIDLPHMAAIRNLRGIFTEIDDYETCIQVMEQIKSGVPDGKQFPFRYLSAHNAVDKSSCNQKTAILDGLEDCMDIACENLPRLKGKNAFLSDNSGSAWGTCTSEYGSMKVAEIGNLSSVIGAMNSDEGFVFPFGDELFRHPISKRQSILNQSTQITKHARNNIGGSTECGIWLFFDEAIRNKEHWDNIFIYSDQQAGHGVLYGTPSERAKYQKEGYSCSYNNRYINVAKLIKAYRNKVNPKVNVFCVQTAGYNNVLVPESGYRTSILYGWTGRELLYADFINSFWDGKDNENL